MLINKSGDILKATENIICHQCNTQGIFGGGLAYQIKGTYPNCELSAINHVRILRGKCEKKDKEIEKLKEREKMLQESFSDWKKGIEKERKYWLCERTDCCGRIKDSKKYSSLYQENKRLNNIIKRFEEDLREVYLTFGEFSEEYTEKKIRELKGDDKE